MKVLFTIILLSALGSQAQIQIERQVISPWVSLGSGSFYLDQTVGQPADQTYQNGEYFLTQGFHQPLDEKLEVTYELVAPDCDDGSGYSLSILAVSGCSEEISAVFWDGEQVDLPVINIDPGEYELVIIGGTGCTFSDVVVVEEATLGPCQLIFYNGISPGIDSINDYWHIENIDLAGFTANTVKIFNRWGSLVWQGNDYDNETIKWTGLSEDGKELSVGTYYWTFEAGAFSHKGFVELLK